MDVLYPGHQYYLAQLDTPHKGQRHHLQFVQREPRHPAKHGTTCQEVIRVLIDRVQFLDKELPWSGNQDIINHLRQALAGFEARALLRKVEKGELDIETLPIGSDGHIEVKQ